MVFKKNNTIRNSSFTFYVGRKTETLQVLDDEGFDKFKSGFVVDPFKGHGVGDVFHPDYGIAVDQREGIARPLEQIILICNLIKAYHPTY